jgi:hypothetical protein
VDVIDDAGPGDPAEVPAEVVALGRVELGERSDSALGEAMDLQHLGILQLAILADVPVGRDHEVAGCVGKPVQQDERMPAAMDDQLLLAVAGGGEAEDATRLVVRRLDVVEPPGGPELLRHGVDFTGSGRYNRSGVVRRLLPLAALAVGLAVAPAGVAHHNPIGMSDPLGDANGAADIVRVTVANDTSGLVLFHVQAPNRTGFVAGDVVLIRIDADRSAQTGEPDRDAGIDYILEIDASANGIFLRRWNGTAFERAETTTLRGVYDGGYVLAVNRADLGNPSAIRFYAVTLLASGAPGQADVAPSTSLYDYELSISHVELMTPRWTPAAPRAGRSFRLSALQVTLQTGDRMPAARFNCRATLAGKRLRGTGRGTCTFRLAASAKGKRLVIAVTASPPGGEAETGVQSFRVR